ncbi:MAG: alpha/beta fold hydrolase, partial [Halococcoides sp.]
DAVDAPTLVVVAENDRIVSPASAERLVERLPHGEGIRVEGGHFDVYDGEVFDRIVAAQSSFFRTHLGS